MFFEIDHSLFKEPDISGIKCWFRDAEKECDIFIWAKDNSIEKYQIWFQGFVIE